MDTLRNILMSTAPVQTLRSLISNDTLADLEPSLAALKMDIPEGYHHKDNLEHSLQVLDNAIAREKNGADLILRTAALFHDIGKPATRKFGTRKAVTFDGHEFVGARMVKRILPKHGYSTKEIKEIAKIVSLHMRSHGFTVSDWTDSAVRRLITDAVNERNLERLLVIFHADCTTKHMHKKAAHYESLRTLDAEIRRVKEADALAARRPAINGNEVMEITGLSQGRELGLLMKYLNSEEGLALSRNEAIAYVRAAQ